ncbi:hypothetical protein PVA45_06065 [Entomospira entomophila]|uniref:Uncharacterized protein n=1 Tax=Entomospira entomophila TaxID=2719988 RepID=A0A968GDK8_9SPIO|nr:hypothetical protein [Entomospira entomophilus]NIZ41064.1 hypothetical protein [Entomospira entomophilus]WDI35273.1 hypothetical protein PVA45_06065 [Entomospira entomophilus]
MNIKKSITLWTNLELMALVILISFIFFDLSKLLSYSKYYRELHSELSTTEDLKEQQSLQDRIINYKNNMIKLTKYRIIMAIFSLMLIIIFPKILKRLPEIERDPEELKNNKKSTIMWVIYLILFTLFIYNQASNLLRYKENCKNLQSRLLITEDANEQQDLQERIIDYKEYWIKNAQSMLRMNVFGFVLSAVNLSRILLKKSRDQEQLK